MFTFQFNLHIVTYALGLKITWGYYTTNNINVKTDFDITNSIVFTMTFYKDVFLPGFQPALSYQLIINHPQVSALASISVILYPSEEEKTIIQLIVSASQNNNFFTSLCQTV